MRNLDGPGSYHGPVAIYRGGLTRSPHQISFINYVLQPYQVTLCNHCIKFNINRSIDIMQ